MEDNEKTKDVSRGNEWEVVSLTASAYAASPGPKKVDSTDDENGSSVNVAETSDALLMSRHFGFPSHQDENLPLQPVNLEVGGDAGPVSVEKCVDENLNIEELISGVYPGIPIFDEKGKLLSISNTELSVPVSKDSSFYSSAELSSFRGESTMVEGNIVNSESTEFYSKDLDSDVPDVPLLADKDSDESKLPCEAWWKKHATSIYTHAKEANSFWSVFVVAAVMGLVILGQRWQQERRQVLQAKWQLSINDENVQRTIRSLGPLSRIRGAIVGSSGQGSITRAFNSVER